MIPGFFRKLIQLFLFPALLILSGLAHSNSFPSVQRFQFTTDSSELQWDAVSNAGGYNIYYYLGGPSQFSITFDYFATVKNATSFTLSQHGLYRVVAFDEDAAVFGDLSSASSIWFREDGTVDDFNDNISIIDDSSSNGEGSTVTFFSTNNDRYIVETTCQNSSTGICLASCKTDGNNGVVTGGFCSSNESHINGSGDADGYSCYSPTIANEIIAGAYCVN